MAPRPKDFVDSFCRFIATEEGIAATRELIEASSPVAEPSIKRSLKNRAKRMRKRR